MSIWKSPVLYIGVLIAALIVGALAAPFIVDWGKYRNDLEAYGRNLSGRAVAIDGPIAVRLFPWPRLEIQDVTVSNPPGFDGETMLQAKKVIVRLALAGLISGEVRVEQIDAEQPKLLLALNKAGEGNWHFGTGKIGYGLLRNVLLEEINIRDGAVSFRDARHGIVRDLKGLDGRASAAALEGPWRMRATGLDGDRPIEFSFSSLEWKRNAPLKFGFKISPTDGSLPSFAFDGSLEDAHASGRLVLDPVVTEDGRSSLLFGIKPLTMSSKIDVLGDFIKLDDIKITAADPKDSGTLIQGSAALDMTQGAQAKIQLNAPHVDIDGLAGVDSIRVWRAGGVMGLLNRAMEAMPASFSADIDLEAASLTAAGESLQNVVLHASVAQNALRVRDFAADLPGRTRVKFAGIAFPGPEAAELGGSLAMESNDTRSLVEWLWPEGKANIATLWTGARGRLKAKADLTWGGKRFGFRNAEYEFDGLPGKGEVALTLGELASLDLKLSAQRFDLATYVSGGLTGLAGAQALAMLAPKQQGFEKRVKLDFGQVSINGVDARQVTVNLASGASGFEIKDFAIGSVEGAEVRGTGLVLERPEGPSGDIKFAIGATRPHGVLRLLGLVRAGPDPAWTRDLGQTDMKAEINVRPGKNEALVSYSVSGTSGPFKVLGSGTLHEPGTANATIGYSGTLSSSDAVKILRLAGINPAVTELGEGTLSATLSGNTAQGFRTALDFEGAGVNIGANGLWDAAKKGFTGTASLTSEDGGNLRKAVGLPFALVGPIAIKTETSAGATGTALQNFVADVGGVVAKGEGVLAADGGLKLDLSGGNLDLSTLLPLALAPWRGQTSGWSDASLEPGWPIVNSAEVRLRPTELKDPLQNMFRENEFTVKASKEGREVSLIARAANGEPVLLDAKLAPQGATFLLSGNVHYPVPLSAVYRNPDGQPVLEGQAVIEGTFESEGRSTLSLRSAVSGNGTVEMDDAKLAVISPDAFFTQLASISNAQDIQVAFAGLTKGNGSNLGRQKLKLTAKSGEVQASMLHAETSGANIDVIPQFDLSNGVLSLSAAFSSKSDASLPPFRIVHEGPPGQMAARSDTAALSAKLGTSLIAKDMAALDAVQKQQEKLIADQEVQAQADKEKYETFQAQRAELRLQLKALKVHATQRALDAARLKAAIDAAVIGGKALYEEDILRAQRNLQQP